jgi:DNA uptake protein ComE-like DNA-binding protein
VVTKQYYDTLRPKLIDNLADGKLWYIIGLILAVLLLLKLFKRFSHLGRYSIAFVVGFYAGLQINGVAQADLGKQLEKAMESVVVDKVDINTATAETMALLPGFSPIIANKVVDQRVEKIAELVAAEFGVDRAALADDPRALGITALLSRQLAAASDDRIAEVLGVKPTDAMVAVYRTREYFMGSPEARHMQIADRVVAGFRSDRPFVSLDQLDDLPALSDMQQIDLAEARGSFAGLDAQATTVPAEEAGTYWFGTFSKLLLLLGLLAGLVYFYFSIEQKGAIGKVSRFGIWVLMIGFGASFGYTVQGRISLAIGRVIDIVGDDKDPHIAEQINGVTVALISVVLIVAALVVWEIRQRRGGDSGHTSSAASHIDNP